jgi:hypothetical protein
MALFAGESNNAEPVVVRRCGPAFWMNMVGNRMECGPDRWRPLGADEHAELMAMFPDSMPAPGELGGPVTKDPLTVLTAALWGALPRREGVSGIDASQLAQTALDALRDAGFIVAFKE